MVLACKVKTASYPAVRMSALMHGVEIEAVDQDDRDTYFDLVGDKSMSVVRDSVVNRAAAVFVLDNSKIMPLPRRAVNV